MQERVHYFVRQRVLTLVRTMVSTITPLLVVIFLLGVALPVKAIIIVPYFNLFGTVIDSQTHQPLAGVTVQVYDISGCHNRPERCVDPRDLIGASVTDSSGLYQINDMFCFNKEMVYVQADGYEEYFYDVNFPCYSTVEHNITLPPAAQEPEPVILIPGIMGSWNRNLLDKNLEYTDEWVLDPHFHTYDGLVADLQTYGGYVLGETLLPFPYDWRQANEFTAQLLAGRIETIKNQTGAQKVDIIAHSMGGLIARQYIQSDLYQDDIDQLIFIATPQRGAPKAYLAWEGGFLGTTMVSDFFKELLVAKIAQTDGFCDSLFDRNRCVYEYVRGYPIVSLQQLLPDYDYLRSSLTAEIFSYPNGYPQNIFLEDLNSTENLDKLYNVGIEISTIYNATPNSTVGEINVIDRTADQEPFWEHGYPDGFGSLLRSNGISNTSGDYTVPYFSSTFLNSDRYVNKLNVKHLSIVSAASQNVIEILKGEFIDINVIDQPDEYVIIEVHSPADMLLTLPGGQKIGKDGPGGNDIVDVAGAYYSGSQAGNEYMIVPKNETGQYNLSIFGTGFGQYQVDVTLADNQGMQTESFSGSIAPDVEIDLAVSIGEEQISPLQPLDQAAPTINIASPISGLYEHHQIIPLIFTALDIDSGIATTSVVIDNEPYFADNLDLFKWHLGKHTLLFRASDWAGNNQEQAVELEIIASFLSVRADIERLYSQGDIKNQKSKKLLLKEADWLEKSQARLEKFIAKHNLPGVVLRRLRQGLAEHMIDKTLDKLLGKQLISPTGYDILKEQFMYIINN